MVNRCFGLYGFCSDIRWSFVGNWDSNRQCKYIAVYELQIGKCWLRNVFYITLSKKSNIINASTIISYLSAISHVHKLISLHDPCFLTIFGAKESDYCPIQRLMNYIIQRREQDSPSSNCLPCILVAMIKLLWYWGIVYLSLTSRWKILLYIYFVLTWLLTAQTAE